MSIIQSDKIVREFASRIHQLLGPKVLSIYWFGSRARGDSTSDSDYDFLLETASLLTAHERDSVVDTSVDVSGKYRVLLDVHYVNIERLQGVRNKTTPFHQAVLEEGIRL